MQQHHRVLRRVLLSHAAGRHLAVQAGRALSQVLPSEALQVDPHPWDHTRTLRRTSTIVYRCRHIRAKLCQALQAFLSECETALLAEDCYRCEIQVQGGT